MKFYKDDRGEFMHYAWLGGYPLAYLDKSGMVCCPACADSAVDQSSEIIDGFVNWEDAGLFCDDCGRRIESAYADNDNEHED